MSETDERAATTADAGTPVPAPAETPPALSHRDRLATIDDEGRRKWIYPKKQDGRFARWRTRVSWVLLAFLFAAPFIHLNGEPLILLNVLERKFILFGLKFWPQDFYLFVLLMIATVVFIFLFTAVYGRIFCGWICPQTVFMEMVFRKLDYLIDGGAREQRALAAAPWTPAKAARRAFKHGIFFGISFLIGNVFLAYIIGARALEAIITDPPARHLGGLVAMLSFSGAFYFVFAWFREQACTLVCPYGRLQSVLLDANSVVISYDHVRGEPRAKYRTAASREGAGDCVDCRQCVVVCPTGIDIRNGTQLECVNCALCIDACDEVMTKVRLPKGLIRYASFNAIVSGTKKLFTPRVIGYSAVLAALVAVFAFLLLSRDDLQTTVLRAEGTLYQEKPGGIVSNLYTVKIVNKTFESIPATLRLLQPEGTLTLVGAGDLRVPPGELVQAAFFIDIPRRKLYTTSTPIVIGVFSGGELIDESRTTFMGPGHDEDHDEDEHEE